MAREVINCAYSMTDQATVLLSKNDCNVRDIDLYKREDADRHREIQNIVGVVAGGESWFEEEL